jgi:D-3-phosphoglycerate dehydrogenase
MFKVKTHNAISINGLERFTRDKYEVASDIAHPDAIMLRSYKMSMDDVVDSLVAVGRAGAGVNNVPVTDYTEKGIVVFNTPGANANAVKELVLTGLLLGSRGIVEGIEYVNSLTEEKDAAAMGKLLEVEKKRFKGTEISGKTLGVVGLGAIGSLVATMALDMGMKVVGYDPALSIDSAWRLPSRVEKMDNLHTLFSKSDFVTIHVPALDVTRGMIDSNVLASSKAGLKLLNFARDEIVDAVAVITALDDKKIAGYISDFPRPELIGRADCISMPHLGASTSEAEDNCAVMAADQLMDFLENGNIKNSVNFPALTLERSSGFRITFSNNNVPKMLGYVLSILADEDLNIIDMLNRSRGDIAYNIIDVDTQPSKDVLSRIEAVEGVIKVRTL